MNKELVSVIIPCYNQTQFLGEAIESVLFQTHKNIEIIVVDDGSTEDISKVIKMYPDIIFIRQINLGLASARNTGWKQCRGNYIVFLDADDRLLPNALDSGLNKLKLHPECGFISGHFRYIKEDGSIKNQYPQNYIEKDHYLAFLKGNYIGMHGTVMYQRFALKAFGGFDNNLKACEDYDLYLRISRKYPVFCHKEIIAEYRRHKSNMSGNFELMLKSVLHVLQLQEKFIQSDPILNKALKTGRKNWTAFYGTRLFKQIIKLIFKAKIKRAGQGVITLIRYSCYYLFSFN